MSKIVQVRGREILDSRGEPTVEVEILLESGFRGRASVPSGASTGEHEAIELRDGDKTRYLGRGVTKAVANVNGALASLLRGRECADQSALDAAMIAADGTPNKSKLGANAILGVSLAAARAAAKESGLPLYRYLGGAGASLLPVPMVNIVNGGRHGDNNADFQEFMIMPIGAPTWSDAIRRVCEVFHNLKAVLKKAGHDTDVGDEGGFAPTINNEEALKYILEAVDRAGYSLGRGGDFAIALDCAASELFEEGDGKGYKFWKSNPSKLFSADEMIELLSSWVERYAIISIEDPLDEDDWDGYARMTKALGEKVQIVGDDFFATSPRRLADGVARGCCNSVLVKVNQIGTLTEALAAIEKAHKAGYSVVVSHRSGETEDSTIADLAVAVNAGQIKTGSACRTDRMCKYNQLLRIEEELGTVARYAGRSVVRGPR